MSKIQEYKNILSFIFLIIKENFPFIFIYLVLQLPLLMFIYFILQQPLFLYSFSGSILVFFAVEFILWQIWLATFFFMIYTLKYNIRKQLQEELNLKSNYPSLIKTEILED